MSRNKLTIGLFGFGCVGEGLFEVLQRTPNLKTTIKKICIKNENKTRSISADFFTTNKHVILDDPEINTVVELIDDADSAYEIVCVALKSGKNVVTANKKMIAENFDSLLTLQRQTQRNILYEGACCASIPIIRNLEEYYDNDLLESIEGIVNGSTNYILTKINKDNVPFSESLKQAQELGFAESNPTLDISGLDAKYKLQILLAHSFGLVVRPENIFNLGIDNLSEFDFSFAKEKGFKIKLIASAVKNASGRITAYVMPKFITRLDPFYDVDDVFNGIRTKSCFSDTQFFVGKGAGAFPTASAVLSDLSALTYNYKYEYKKIGGLEQLTTDNEVFLKVLLRHDLAYGFEYKRAFEHIDETYCNLEIGYIIGVITLRNLKLVMSSKIASLSVVLFEQIEYNKWRSKSAKIEAELVS